MQHGSGHICAFNEFMITSRCSRDPKPERQEQCDEPHTQSKTHESTEQNTPENPVISRMTRGHPPWVAIEEAMHHAERLGYLVSGVNSRTFPCDFMAIHDGHITLVRVGDSGTPAMDSRTSWHPAGERSLNSRASRSRRISAANSGSGVRTDTGTGTSSFRTG